MSSPGGNEDVLVRARSVLLDALDALGAHRNAVIVIGAQAIYLRTEDASVAVAEATKDGDIAIDPRALGDEPLIEELMERAGFYPDPNKNQPGAWLSNADVPVDLMVPEELAGGGVKSARGARIPPHNKHATRRARGLEAVVVDNDWMTLAALDPADPRQYEVRVAGLAALVVAKLSMAMAVLDVVEAAQINRENRVLQTGSVGTFPKHAGDLGHERGAVDDAGR